MAAVLKPHKGQFQAGFDPRRNGTRVIEFEGKTATLAEHCRLRTPQALAVLVNVMDDKTAPVNERMRAANAILDRGWGKPAESIKVQADMKVDVTDYTQLSTVELLEVARAARDPIEGEYAVLPEPQPSAKPVDLSHGIKALNLPKVDPTKPPWE